VTPVSTVQGEFLNKTPGSKSKIQSDQFAEILLKAAWVKDFAAAKKRSRFDLVLQFVDQSTAEMKVTVSEEQHLNRVPQPHVRLLEPPSPRPC